MSSCATEDPPKHIRGRKFPEAAIALDTYDRARCGVAFRMIEVLMSHGENRRALGVLHALLYDGKRDAPTLDTYASVAFDYRTASMLESRGYHTLRDCMTATDAELLSIPNIGERILAAIRRAVQCVLDGQPLPDTDDLTELAYDWPPHNCDGHDCIGPVVSPVCPSGDLIVSIETSAESKVEATLSVLLESKEEALSEIDAKIDRLTADIANLKRMRKLLAPAGAGKPGGKSADKDYSLLAERIVDAIAEHGPMRAKQVGKVLGEVNYTYIGRAVANSPALLRKRDDNVIELA